MKRVFVYPCGTEIGLEIYRSMNKSTYFELWGGSSSYDHGRFVYKNHVDNLPFITDSSTEDEIKKFDEQISRYQFDFIYPAMDGVLTIFAKYRSILRPIVIAPESGTAEITRSKKKTYETLTGVIPVPEVYGNKQKMSFPVFVKPDMGQGSVGASVIRSQEDLERILKKQKDIIILEYLPGEEYTIDCFTNTKGKLVYSAARGRKRVKGGISVNTVFEDREIFWDYGEKINKSIRQKGGWFFQVKQDRNGTLKLLEVASRIAGTSSISRMAGANLPLMTTFLFDGSNIDSVLINPCSGELELDRALSNCFRWNINYNTIYVDYDDTLIVNSKINTQLILFLYQCINEHKQIILLTKHDGNIEKELQAKKVREIFDEIIHLNGEDSKSDYIKENSIFIDDSYGEREMVFKKCGIPVFDVHMIEGLLEERD